MLSIGLTDLGFSIYESYSHASQSSVGMAAHIGGAMGGFLVGINVVRNFHSQVLFLLPCLFTEIFAKF